jgi:putative ABC transport system permease protein
MVQAIRLWRRQPWLALAAIVSLALGIGGTTAIFSVMNAVVLRPLPFSAPDRLVAIWETSDDNPARWLAPANFLDLQREARSFSALAVYDGFPLNLTGRSEAERLTGGGASGTFFPTLGVTAALGRTLMPSDDAPDAAAVTVLGFGLAERLFGTADRAVGQTLILEGRVHEIVGVLPQAFSVPTLPNVEIWVNGDRGIPRSFPFPGDITAVRDSHFLLGVGRLADGVSPQAARDELQAIMARLEREHPDTNAGLGANVIPLHSQVVGDVRPLVLFLQLAVIAMLAIGCANVASLLLGHAAGRQRELATRLALGAGRATLVRQLLFETAVIAVPGGILGLLLAVWGLDALVALAPAALPRVGEIAVDGRVLTFTVAITLLTAVAFGLGPALGAARRAASTAAQPGLRVAGDRSVSRWHRVMVVGELAVAQVLLVSAGLMLASFTAAQDVSLGFDSERRLAAYLSLSADRYMRPVAGADEGRVDTGPKRELIARVLEELRATPGVRAASAAFTAPLAGAPNRGVRITSAPLPPPGQEPEADFQAVSSDFFRTNAIALVAGRVFDDGDRDGAVPVAIVNEAFVTRYFGGRDPMGQELLFGPDHRHQIVGVVADARYRDVEKPADPTFYVPMDQNHERWPFLAFMAWTDGDPVALAPVLRRAVREVDPNQPLARIQTYDEILARAVAPRRFNALLAGLFAATALVLAAVGTYGVLAYTVGTRTRELGVRAALGATRADLARLVASEGGGLTVIALLVGGVGAWVASRWMAALLFHVQPGDPRTLVQVSALLAAVAALAIWLPARQATAVDPNRALKEP